ncbi:MAG: dihydrofolate reductase family protein [Bacteroidetes bacterium]|nr:dihydrofolate reductase family protein [Bacteroidota bacterium]
MRKLIFAINVTVDGYADHTAVIADDELHDFYTKLFDTVDTVLFGRETYQLMESFWPNAHKDSRCTNSMIAFAKKINSVQKLVFSNTLNEVNWDNTRLIKNDIIEEVSKLKAQSGKNISVGGLSFASTLMKHGLIDEYWFLVQPIVAGEGRRLFSQRDGLPERLENSSRLQLIDTQKLNSGVVVLHYKNN